MSSAAEILQKAITLVTGDRQRSYGDKTINHQNIADQWNAYLKGRLIGELGPLDAAIMMALLKIARIKLGEYHPDNYDDGAAYMAIAGEIASKEQSS